MLLHVFFLTQLFKVIQPAKILGIFPCPGYSQFILGDAIMQELASNGHEVTMISPYFQKNKPKNLTYISVSGLSAIGSGK